MKIKNQSKVRFRHKLEYLCFLFLIFLTKKCKIETLSNVFSKVAMVVGFLLRRVRRYRIALSNSEIIFPNKTLHERHGIIIRSYANIGRFVAEYFYQNRIDKKWFEENVTIEGAEHIAKYKENGFFCFGGHVGNWELIHVYLRLFHDIHLKVIFKKQKNPLMNDLVAEARMLEHMEKGSGSMKNLISNIKGKYVVGTFVDQKDKRGSQVDFFGKPCFTSTAIQRLSLKYNYPMLCVMAVRTKKDPNKFLIKIQPPLEEIESDNFDEKVLDLTKKSSEMIEKCILEYPDQWLWIHDRWSLHERRR